MDQLNPPLDGRYPSMSYLRALMKGRRMRIMKRVQFIVEMDVPDDDEKIDTRPETLPVLATTVLGALTNNNLRVDSPVHVEYRGYRVVHTEMPDNDLRPPLP